MRAIRFAVTLVTMAALATIVRAETPPFFVLQWGSQGSAEGQFDSPAELAFGGGVVYVAEGGNNRVQRFDGDGIFQSAWGSGGSSDGQFSSPSGIAVDGIGNVYVADTGNHRI